MPTQNISELKRDFMKAETKKYNDNVLETNFIFIKNGVNFPWQIKIRSCVYANESEVQRERGDGCAAAAWIALQNDDVRFHLCSVLMIRLVLFCFWCMP